MRVACFALALYATAFLAHWLWWRIRVPKRQTATLLTIFFGVLALGLSGVPWLPWLAAWQPEGGWQMLHVGIFHTALTLAYVVAYSAIEERSPSMTMLLHVASSDAAGCSREDLYAALGNITPLQSRLDAMVRDQMIEAHDGTYQITRKGIGWSVVFGRWRRLIGLAKGG